MATRTLSCAPTNSSDALFRVWINEIHNAITAFGWVQTSDTGQVNFSTVTRPTAVNTFQGYSVYRMGDSLQSTTPFFIRFDYGTCNTTDAPGIKFQVGPATDGAGNIVYPGGFPQISTSGSAGVASASSFNCRTSGNSSSFRLNFWCGTGGVSEGWMIVIERDKDSSGADTALGFSMAWCLIIQNNNSISLGSTFISNDGTWCAVDTGGFYAMVTNNSSQTSGGSTGIGPVRCALGPLRNAMLGLAITARTDWTNESTNSVTIYGASHTYLMLRPSGGSNSLNRWNTDCGFAMLWE